MTVAGTPVLAADKVEVIRGRKPVLRAITFTVEPGEFIGLIGPNGAGKSTLLRSVGGLQPVAAGEIRVRGRPVTSLGGKEIARIIAYLPQEINDGFGFTAREVVLAGRYPYLKWWQNEREADYQIARKYMAFTGVAALADKSLRQVSGGERQRILLAKVLTQETPVILLDEPTASLDLAYQEEIFRYCRVLSRQGKTVLLIAHDVRLAAKFCSRLILLAAGRIVADGEPAAVVTGENLAAAYGLQAAVFTSKVTGQLDIHTYAAGTATGRPAVHIIGGGGSAGNLIRMLFEKSYKLSGGVFQQGDTDADVALAFGVDYVTGPAFSTIDENQGRQNRVRIAGADWTVLSNLCYGPQNLDNLKAAFTADRLIVIEDEPIANRDFTGGRAAALYRELLARPGVTVLTTAGFLARVEADGLPE